jgi:tetratricopeptide (TPR) repeat protein/predicted aspartyl protease
MKLHSILGSLLAPIVALAGFSAHAACNLAKLPDLPVTMEGPRAIVPATVNGVDGRFMVETGSFFSSLSAAVVAKDNVKLGPSEFGMTVTGAGGGHADYSVATAQSFVIDGMSFHRIDFIVLKRGAGSADGAIGQNILSAPDVEYDFANGAIRLFQPTGCRDADMAYWDSSQTDSILDIVAADPAPAPAVTATLNGMKIHVLFESGTARSMVSLAAAARAGVKPSDPGVVSVGSSAGVADRSQFRIWRGRFASFKIGGEEIKNTPLLFGDLNMQGVDMLLGADFFLSHRIFVANSQHKIYFTYNGGPVFNLDAAPPQPVIAAQAPPPAAKAPADPNAETPQDAAGYARRGAAYASRREYTEAIADLTKAIALSPSDPDFLYDRGRSEIGNLQPFLAMADFGAALKLKPDDVPVLLLRAQLYSAEHQPDQAKADLAAADGFAAEQPDQRLALGSVYGKLRMFEEVIPELDAWIAAHPKDEHLAGAYNNRCWARAELGVDLDKALADCNEALKLDPGNPNMLDSRGLVLLRTGDLDKSMADYNAALRLLPNAPNALYGRGLAELRKGMVAEGHADLAAATAINPKLPDEAKAVGLTP